MTLQFNPDQFRAHVGTLAEKANTGCGLIYELYQRRLSASIDAHVAMLPAEHREPAIELAREEFDYLTADEIEAEIARDHEQGICCHGIDRDCCPVGCGDLEF